MIAATLVCIIQLLKAGISDEKLVEAHGAFNTGHCIDCRKKYTQVLPLNGVESVKRDDLRIVASLI